MKAFELIKYIKTALLLFNIYDSQVMPGNLFLEYKQARCLFHKDLMFLWNGPESPLQARCLFHKDLMFLWNGPESPLSIILERVSPSPINNVVSPDLV
jgi:hypothetical protein